MPDSLRILPDRLVENLERVAYQYAVTMQNIPHYYTLARKWADYKDEVSEEIRWTVREMWKHDVTRPFMGREQHYLDVNGFSYWTMGPRETPLRFDTIVAMAGAGSHVTGVDVVEKAQHLLAPGGRAYLMFYRDPAAAFDRMGIEATPLAATPDGAVGDGEYVVVEVRQEAG